MANWLGRPVVVGYSPQSRRVLALFVYNCPECPSCRNRPKVIETSKLVELQLLRPRSPNCWSRVTWPAVGTVQLLRLVCRGLSLPRVLLNLSAFIQMPSEAYPTVIWTIVIIRDSMYFLRLFFCRKWTRSVYQPMIWTWFCLLVVLDHRLLT